MLDAASIPASPDVAPDRDAIILRYATSRLPRYTSYPTAPHFTSAIGAADYGAWLRQVPAGVLGSLYLHIPFCREMCWYCGCHTKATRRTGPVERYLDALEREIDGVAAALPHRLTVGHVHWGGGSPSLVPPDRFVAVMDRLRDRFNLLPDAEVAVEIDPRTLTDDFAAAMAAGGVNRASLGVQTTDACVQVAINRVQDWDTTAGAAARLRAAGIDRLNVDLLYGLPRQTAWSCRATVARVLDLAPDRISVFGYAHVPHMKRHQRMIAEADLPDGRERLAQADAIADSLQDAGFVAIGLDHFARAGDPLAVAQRAGTLRRNFQGYTTDAADVLLGFGASAIGKLPQGYVQNEPAIGTWQMAAMAGGPAIARGLRLTPEDRLRAEVIERLMCDLAVDPAAIAARHGLPAPAADLDDLARLGVVERHGGTVAVAAGFRPLVRAVAAAYDERLAASTARHAVAV